MSKCFRHTYESPGSLFGCRSGACPFEYRFRAVSNGPGARNLVNLRTHAIRSAEALNVTEKS